MYPIGSRILVGGRDVPVGAAVCSDPDAAQAVKREAVVNKNKGICQDFMDVVSSAG
jgi:hypothetical protein